MAEDIREQSSGRYNVGEDRRRQIIRECLRQEESCLYTSTSLFIWLRRVRLQRQVFVAAPILLGALASFTVLKEVAPTWLVATLALAASLFPALADALKIQTSVDEIARLAAEFKALQDRFRRTARIKALGELEEVDAALAELMDRMDVARSASITPPDKFFELARKKVRAGHYNFAVDEPPSAEAKSIEAPLRSMPDSLGGKPR